MRKDESAKILSDDWKELIVEDAKTHNYGLVSFWSMGRDAKLEYNIPRNNPRKNQLLKMQKQKKN